MHELSPQEQILKIVNNYWQGCAVGAAAELELADMLASEPLHVDVLAERCGAHGSSLYRMLRALESTGVFKETAPGIFANTPASDCLRRHAPGSQWAWIRLTLSGDGMVRGGWGGLMHSIRTGEPGFEKIHGQTGWEYMQQNPQQGTIFNEAMRALAAAITPAVTSAYDWGRFPIIADIGGGVGSQLIDILDANSNSRGVLFDQPQAVAEAPQHDRMDAVGGDFFEGVPPADVYILRWILHDWDDEKSLAILNAIRQSAKPDCVVAIVESVIPETAEFDMGKWMDLNMLVMAGGKERTAAEFRDLLDRAGFDLDEIVTTPSPLSIIAGKPKR